MAIKASQFGSLNKRRANCYFQTVLAVVSSPHVKRYVIGMTGLPLWYRRNQHFTKERCKHLVVIVDKMTGHDALKMEEELQGRCLRNPEHFLYRKYHEKHRAPRRTPGGGKKPMDDPDYSVYVAWWDCEMSN